MKNQKYEKTELEKKRENELYQKFLKEYNKRKAREFHE